MAIRATFELKMTVWGTIVRSESVTPVVSAWSHRSSSSISISWYLTLSSSSNWWGADKADTGGDAGDALTMTIRWCAHTSDVLVLLMRWCCWCAEAADALMLLMRWYWWYADAVYDADALMLLVLLMRWCCWGTDVLMRWCYWCADALTLLFCWCADGADRS